MGTPESDAPPTRVAGKRVLHVAKGLAIAFGHTLAVDLHLFFQTFVIRVQLRARKDDSSNYTISKTEGVSQLLFFSRTVLSRRL